MTTSKKTSTKVVAKQTTKKSENTLISKLLKNGVFDASLLRGLYSEFLKVDNNLSIAIASYHTALTQNLDAVDLTIENANIVRGLINDLFTSLLKYENSKDNNSSLGLATSIYNIVGNQDTLAFISVVLSSVKANIQAHPDNGTCILTGTIDKYYHLSMFLSSIRFTMFFDPSKSL